MSLLALPYPGNPPASPHLGGLPGGVRRYEHLATTVCAELDGGVLRTPVPRAAFHAEELAGAFDLGDDFRAAFARANRDADEPDAPRMAVELGLQWWRFTIARGDLRRGWPAADIIVPDLLLFARRAGGAVTTVLVWPDDVRALVIPDAAEHIVLKSGAARLAGPPVLVPRAALIAVAAERLVAFAAPVPHRLYRGGSAHRDVLATLRTAVGDPASGYRAVRADEVRDPAAEPSGAWPPDGEKTRRRKSM